VGLSGVEVKNFGVLLGVFKEGEVEATTDQVNQRSG